MDKRLLCSLYKTKTEVEKWGGGKGKAPRHGNLHVALLVVTKGLARSQILFFESFPGEKKTNKTLNKAKLKL